jgi:hypothetical protein
MVNNRPVTRLRTSFFSRTNPDPTQKTRKEIRYRVKWFHDNPFRKSETLLAKDAAEKAHSQQAATSMPSRFISELSVPQPAMCPSALAILFETSMLYW